MWASDVQKLWGWGFSTRPENVVERCFHVSRNCGCGVFQVAKKRGSGKYGQVLFHVHKKRGCGVFTYQVFPR
jgi:hypothetical protein